MASVILGCFSGVRALFGQRKETGAQPDVVEVTLPSKDGDLDSPTNNVTAEEPYDFIIVGGGIAGLVVANRLSEINTIRVLLVEAGGDQSKNPLVLTPGLAGGMLGKDEYIWSFVSPPQPELNNRRVTQGKGRMLGGSSGLNHMMVLYPNRAGIDAWGQLGNSGWSFKELAPYYRKFTTTSQPYETHTWHKPEVSKSETGGPVKMSYSDSFDLTNAAWVKAFSNLGLTMTSDPREGATPGAFQNAWNIDPVTNTRSYAASSYLTDEVQNRDNLTIVTNTLVKRIIFEKIGESEDVQAKGVVVWSKSQEEKTYYTKGEVIMAAGTLHTPQVLELSGIGGKELLEKHGIAVLIDNPNVGEHIQDHPLVTQSFEVAPGVPSMDVFRDPVVLEAALKQYEESHSGPLAEAINSAAYAPLVGPSGPLSIEECKKLCDTYLTSSNATGQRKEVLRRIFETPNEPIMEYLILPAQVGVPPDPKSFADHMIQTAPENYISIMTMLAHPLSQGSCHILSRNIDDKPLWDPNYNTEAIDIEVMARGVQFVESLVHTPPFSDILKRDGKRMPDIKADSLESAKEIVRIRQIAAYHASGSCAMLPRDLGGVVNDRLKVYGASNLRIVDASIFPLEPLGNIQTAVYAVAEKAADIIKEDKGLLSKQT